MNTKLQAKVHRQAIVDKTAQIGRGSIIWENVRVREDAILGERVSIGAGSYIGVGVVVGSFSRIQNGARIYDPACIGSGVFIGPNAVLTNDRFPRAVMPDGSVKSSEHWVPVGVVVKDGASVGAGAICVAPIEIGEWAVVGAGAVVTTSVAPHSLVVGNPARHVAWVGRAGYRLVQDGLLWRCHFSGEVYTEKDSRLSILEGSLP